MKVEAAQGKQVLWNGLRQWGTLGLVARPWCSSRVSCRERILLRWDGNAQNSLPTKQGKDPSCRARRRKRGSSGCGRYHRASSRVETGMSGNFLSCSKAVKDPLYFPGLDMIILETPQWKCASHILEVRTSWIFSSCGRCSCLMTVTTGTDSGGLRTGQSPFELFGGFWGFLSFDAGA